MIDENKKVNLTIENLILTLENSYTGLIGEKHYLCRGDENLGTSCIIKWDVEGIEEPTPEVIMKKFEIIKQLFLVTDEEEESVTEINLELPDEPSIDEIS